MWSSENNVWNFYPRRPLMDRELVAWADISASFPKLSVQIFPVADPSQKAQHSRDASAKI